MSMNELVHNGKAWLKEAREIILDSMDEILESEEKASRVDIVTAMDIKVQEFLVGKIEKTYPNDKILGEESGYNQLEDRSGRVWIIDPIDGTSNFYFQKTNFAILMAVFVDGIGKIGFIYDIMQDNLYWGGREFGGVYRNEVRLAAPKKRRIRDGLVSIASSLYGDAMFDVVNIGKESMGVRSHGASSMEFIALLEGRVSAVIDYSAPWDWTAGSTLAQVFGFEIYPLGKDEMNWEGYDYFVCCYPEDYMEFFGNKSVTSNMYATTIRA